MSLGITYFSGSFFVLLLVGLHKRREIEESHRRENEENKKQNCIQLGLLQQVV
jgi:hypothetical protein